MDFCVMHGKIFGKAINNNTLEVTQLAALGKDVRKNENVNIKLGCYPLAYFVLLHI